MSIADSSSGKLPSSRLPAILSIPRQAVDTDLDTVEQGLQDLRDREAARTLLQKRSGLTCVKSMLKVALDSWPMPDALYKDPSNLTVAERGS